MTKNYLLHLYITLAACFAAYILFWIAEGYAWYIMDRNTQFPSGPFKYFGENSEMYHPLNFTFLITFLVVLLNKYSYKLRITWVYISVLLMVSCIFMIGSGGDRKGCTACDGFLVYALIVPIPALASCIFGGYKIYRNRKKC